MGIVAADTKNVDVNLFEASDKGDEHRSCECRGGQGGGGGVGNSAGDPADTTATDEPTDASTGASGTGAGSDSKWAWGKGCTFD